MSTNPLPSISLVSIADLKLDEANPRIHNERNLKAIKNSLEAFGQQKPIVIDAGKNVIAGNGVVIAAKELGWTELQCITSALTKTELIAYRIADNKTSDLGDWDYQVVSDLLRTLEAEEDKLLQQIGFEEYEIGHFLSIDWNAQNEIEGDANDPVEEWNAMPEFHNDDLTAHKKLIVHFRNVEDIRDFEKRIGQAIGKQKSIWHPRQESTNLKQYGYA